MFKRFVVMIAVLGISLIGMLGTAEAHYVPTFSGWAWHSVECSVDLKSVPNPDAVPAVVECVVVTSVVESLCVNNGGNLQPQGNSHAPVTITGTTEITPTDITNKKKGIAHVKLTVGTGDGVANDPPLDSDFCANPNWTNVANLIRSFAPQINTFKCLDDACTNLLLVSTVVAEECTLPPEFNFDGYDIGLDPFNPGDDVCPNCPMVGDLYVCPNTVFAHVN